MRVLGIESSCDETGVALYDSERGLLAHQLYSQVKMHAEFGGVVPELASRDHIRTLLPLIQATFAEADCDVGLVAYEMAVLVEKAGTVLTPELRAELQASLPR